MFEMAMALIDANGAIPMKITQNFLLSYLLTINEKRSELTGLYS